MITEPTRRRFLVLGLAAVCSPAIVRATSIMPVRAWRETTVFLTSGTTWTLPEDYLAETLRSRCGVLAENVRANNGMLQWLRDPWYSDSATL